MRMSFMILAVLQREHFAALHACVTDVSVV